MVVVLEMCVEGFGFLCEVGSGLVFVNVNFEWLLLCLLLNVEVDWVWDIVEMDCFLVFEVCENWVVGWGVGCFCWEMGIDDDLVNFLLILLFVFLVFCGFFVCFIEGWWLIIGELLSGDFCRGWGCLLFVVVCFGCDEVCRGIFLREICGLLYMMFFCVVFLVLWFSFLSFL